MFNGILFQQSLQDLVKGIRAHRRDEDEYIRAKVAEIGQECRSADVAKKTTGVLKLAHVSYLATPSGAPKRSVSDFVQCGRYSMVDTNL